MTRVTIMKSIGTEVTYEGKGVTVSYRGGFAVVWSEERWEEIAYPAHEIDLVRVERLDPDREQ